MSVGEDQKSNPNPSPGRGWAARLGRRHTFIIGLVAGAGALEAGRAVGPLMGNAPAAVSAVSGRSAVQPMPPLTAETSSEPTPPAPTTAPAPDDAAPAPDDAAPAPDDAAPEAEAPAIVEPSAPVPTHFAALLTTRAAPSDLTYRVPVPDLVRREGALKPRQRVAEILSAAGVTEAAQADLVRALRGKFDFRYAQPGQRYRVEVDHRGQVRAFELRAAVDEVYRVRRTEDDRLDAVRVDIPLTREIVQVDGVIETSLWDAFINAGESPALAMDLADAFKFDIDFFHDTRKGDRFRLFVEKFSNDEGQLVRYGRVYAAEYDGALRSPVGTKRLFWFKGTKTKGYYDEKGKAAQRAFLRSPLKFTRVSSPFGYRRHPILGRRHFHGGVDYAAPTGTPVQAVASGRVTFARRKGPNGNMVRIRHSGGYESLYLHLSRILVRKGQRVGQSTMIGRVGSTGRSTGPHLDFRLKKNGRYINPRKHVAPRTKRVARADRRAYFRAIEPWLAKLDAAASR